MPTIPWQGTLLAVQPRIRLTRSFDERTHTYLGYALRLGGAIGEQRGEFLVGIGTGTQAKHRFRAGDVPKGESQPVADPRSEPVDYYKTVRLELRARGPARWRLLPRPGSAASRTAGVPGARPPASRSPDLRGEVPRVPLGMPHAGRYDRGPVEAPRRRPLPLRDLLLRAEVLPALPAGAAAQGAGRKGVTWEEADWVDKDATAHRAADE